MKLRHVLWLALACALAPSPTHAITINVEIDWLESAGHSHKPSVCELQAVVAAFAAQGHTLNYELSDGIPETDANRVIDFTDSEGFDSGDGDWHDLESEYRDRGDGWHYCIFGHNYSDDGKSTTSSGLAEINGDDVLVSLGSFSGQIGTTFDRAGTFMHELGHNLGLRHAGDQNEDDIGQYKPNFPSLMAYRYQLRGVRTGLTCMGLASSGAAAAFRELDYSHGARPSLDEDALCESDGIGLGTGVDWNCSGGSGDCDKSVARDLSNGDDWCVNSGNRDELTDYDDWSNISDSAKRPDVMKRPQPVIRCITAEEAMVDKIQGFSCTQPAPCEEGPAVDVSASGGDVGPGCAFTAHYSAHITNTVCGIDPASVDVSASSLDGRSTVGVPSADVEVLDLNEIVVSGQVTISALTGCPARVRIRVQAADGCGRASDDEVEIAVSDPQIPLVELSATGGDVDEHCVLLAPYSAVITDNCSVDGASIQVTAASLDGNATIGTPTVEVNAISPTEVRVSGHVSVSAVLRCPARVRIQVEARDRCGSTHSDTRDIEVVDRIPPTIVATLDPSQLWPPNHRMVDIQASVEVADNCPVANFVLTSVASDEPEDDRGDGHTAPDIAGVSTGTPDLAFQLRAERDGRGDGRTYTATYTATDGCENSATTTAVVTVAHDQRAAVVPGPGFTTAGRDLESDLDEFALVVPTIPRVDRAAPPESEGSTILDASRGLERATETGFNARSVDVQRAVIANSVGIVAASRAGLVDATGDGFDDLVLFYPTGAVRQLFGSPAAGPPGLYLRVNGGGCWAVDDILSLGAPIALPSGLVTAAISPSTGNLEPETREPSRPLAPGPSPDPPGRTRLIAARPNPTLTGTEVTFDLARETEVRLSVFDVRGALVCELWSGRMTSGRHAVAWDGLDRSGRRLASGTYVVKLTADGRSQILKAALLR